MNKTFQSEKLESVLSKLPPGQREEIEKRARELAMNEDFRRAAGILEKSESLENAKFVSELGWLAALSIAIAVIAV